MAVWMILGAFLLFAVSAGSAQQCRNEYGEPVDWFYLYKMPRLQQPNDFFLRKGLGYIYLTSKHPTADWRLGMRSINDSKSIIGRILAPLYNKTVSPDLFHIMYNDDPPTEPSALNFGHTKGVVISDGQEGIWLVHSSPNFPIETVSITNDTRNGSNRRVKTWNTYFYPESGTKFGQTFLCITLKAKDLNAVGNALMYNRPKIYSVNLPSGMKENFPNLTRAANGEYIKSAPWQYKTVVTTVEGNQFTVYAKTKKFLKDLYAGFVAPDLESDLEVETWRNGPGDMPSDCKGNYTVKNVVRLGIRMEQNVTYRFTRSHDHSKWAVSDKAKSTVCVGDINRMEPQLRRGGGTVCFRNTIIWGRFKKTVEETEPCSSHTSFHSDSKPKH